jgi:hypothetical protein
MRNPKYSFYLNGELITNPIEWQEIQVLATFDTDAVQANVSTSEITFALDASKKILQWVEDGSFGIFEGIPFDIIVTNGNESTTVGKYIIDFSTYRVLEDGKIVASFSFADGLNQIAERLEATTFGWLENEGFVNNDDYTTIPYVVKKENDIIEIISISILTAFMAKAIADSSKALGDRIAAFAGISAAGITGTIGAVIYATAALIVALAYTISLLIAFTKLFIQFLEAFITIPRTHKVMSYKRMFEIVGSYLGYKVYTNLPLEDYYYLPSNTSADIYNTNGFLSIGKGTQKGIPSSNDYGYTLSEFMDLIKKLFNGKYAVVNNTLVFLNIDDDYWRRLSSFTLRQDTYAPYYQYNNNDLKANQLFSFTTDISDSYTITEYKGTAFQVVTTPKISNVEKHILLKGLENIQFPIALGTTKTELSAFDRILLGVATLMDSVSRFFGGSGNYASRVRGMVDALKVSSNNYSVPKILYMKNGIIPRNHRNFLSAKYFYNNYYLSMSFVANNFRGQKIMYENIKIPFSYSDWIEVSQNSYITDFKGNEGKITQLKWSVGSDYAEIDFWVRKPYTKNLQETYIEP